MASWSRLSVCNYLGSLVHWALVHNSSCLGCIQNTHCYNCVLSGKLNAVFPVSVCLCCDHQRFRPLIVSLSPRNAHPLIYILEVVVVVEEGNFSVQSPQRTCRLFHEIACVIPFLFVFLYTCLSRGSGPSSSSMFEKVLLGVTISCGKSRES